MANKDNKDKDSKKFVADRESDQNPLANKDDGNKDTDTSGRDVTGNATATQVGRGEQLAQEAAEKNDGQGGVADVKIVEKDGVRSAVSTPAEDKSDNGKVYKDARVNPRDTNAPDAGLTPDGRRIAE